MTQDITMQAARIDVPVHLIAGGDDPVEPEASLRAAFGQVLRGVNIVVVPGVGHIAPLEAPAKLAHAIRLCVDGVTTRPPPQERASPRPALR